MEEKRGYMSPLKEGTRTIYTMRTAAHHPVAFERKVCRKKRLLKNQMIVERTLLAQYIKRKC